MAEIDEAFITSEVNRVRNLNTDNKRKADELKSRIDYLINRASSLGNTTSYLKGNFGNKYLSYNDNILTDLKTLSSFCDNNLLLAMRDVDKYVENTKRIESLIKQKEAISLEDQLETSKLRKKKFEEYLKDGRLSYGEIMDSENFYLDDGTVNPELRALRSRIMSLKQKIQRESEQNGSLLSSGHRRDNEINLHDNYRYQAELESLMLRYKDLLEEESNKYQFEMNNIKVQNPKLSGISSEIQELISENRKLLLEIENLSRDDIKAQTKRQSIKIGVRSGVIDSYKLNHNYIRNIPSMRGIVVKPYNKKYVRSYKIKNGYYVEAPYRSYLSSMVVLKHYVRAKETLLGKAHINIKKNDGYINYIQNKNVLHLDKGSTDIITLRNFENKQFISQFANQYTSLLTKEVDTELKLLDKTYEIEKDNLAREYARRYHETQANGGDLTSLKRFYEDKSRALDELRTYKEQALIRRKNEVKSEVEALYSKYDSMIKSQGKEQVVGRMQSEMDYLYNKERQTIRMREEKFLAKRDFTSYEAKLEMNTLIKLNPEFRSRLMASNPNLKL